MARRVRITAAAVVSAGLLWGCSHTDNGLTKADYRDLTQRTPPPGAGGPGSGSTAEPPIPEMQPILAAPPPPALEQRLVTVNVPDPDVPLRDVLIELARKVGVDLDLDPKISGGIILYAKDRPFAEVIDRICDMANLRYSFRDNVLRIEIDTMVHRDYRLDILNSVRKASMAVSTSTDVFSSVQGGGSAQGNNSSSQVQSDSTNDPWKDITDNLTQILVNSNPATQPIQSNVIGAPAAALTHPGANGPATTEAPAPGAPPSPGAPAAPGAPAPAAQSGGASPPFGPVSVGTQGSSNQAVDSGAGGAASGAGGTQTGTAAPATGTTNPIAAAQQQILNQATGGTGASEPLAPVTAPASAAPPAAAINSQQARFSVNKSAGIVSVFGTMRQQRLVQDYLSKIVAEATSQVLIEAKVVEVDLNDQYRTGIDWQKIIKTNNGNTFAVGTNLGGAGLISDQSNFGKQLLDAATANPFAISWTGRDFASLLNFVEGFGTTRTLSSPRITVLNNQTAVLKVAENQVYFQLTATTTPSTTVGIPPTATYSSTLHTVPIGVVMTVQPVIDLDKQQVTMSLRPTVSVHTGDVSDPAVALSLATNCNGSSTGACSPSNISSAVTNSNVPVVEVREMDSVVTLPSGDIVVMGGLMQSNTQKQDTGVPGAADVPLIGNLFKAQSDETDVTELVIFLKASIVHGSDTVDWADKDVYKRYIQDPRPLAF